METIGEKIKILRTKNNLSQERFAKKVGISGKSVSAYETCRAFPSLKILEKIEKVYEVSLSDIPRRKREELSKQLDTCLSSLNAVQEILKQINI